MTVQQYVIRFNQLSWFTPDLEATPTERVRRFVRRFKLKTRMDVLSTERPTYKENVKNDFWAEDTEQQIRANEAKDKGVQPGFKRNNPDLSYVQQ